MKLSVKPEHLKYMILGAGGLGLVLRTALYASGVDEKGLLVRNHWAGILLWVLTAVVALALILLTRDIRGPERYRDAYPVSFAGGAGAILAAVAVLFVAVGDASSLDGTPLSLLMTAVGFAAAAALAFIGFCRLAGAKPLFLCNSIVCIFFALRMVCLYRSWSSDPQLQDYCFYLGTYICLMLTAYQQAAFDAGLGKHSRLWLLSLSAVYLCCLSLRGTADAWLLFTCGVWAYTNMTTLTVKPKRQRPALNLEDEPPRKEV